jgi:hypothetical protein
MAALAAIVPGAARGTATSPRSSLFRAREPASGRPLTQAGPPPLPIWRECAFRNCFALPLESTSPDVLVSGWIMSWKSDGDSPFGGGNRAFQFSGVHYPAIGARGVARVGTLVRALRCSAAKHLAALTGASNVPCESAPLRCGAFHDHLAQAQLSLTAFPLTPTTVP